MPLMTNMNLESVKSGGHNVLRIMFVVLDYLNSNVVVCCLPWQKLLVDEKIISSRSRLGSGMHDKKYLLNCRWEEMLSSCTGMMEVFRGKDLY